MFANWIAYSVNNSLLLVAGGMLAMLMTWAAWHQFDRYYHEIRSSGQLAFSVAKAVAIVIVMGWVARSIYGGAMHVQSSIANSGSVEAAGQLAINVGHGLDYLVNSAAPTGGELKTAGVPQFPVSTPDILVVDTGNSGLGEMAKGNRPSVTATPISVAVNAIESSISHVAPVQYTVRPGDSMFEISRQLLGSGKRYLELCRLNQSIVGSDCSRIRSGMVLSLPKGESPALAKWNNAITHWKVEPPVVRKEAQGWSNAVTQWKAPASVTPPPQSIVMQSSDLFAPAANPSAQATKDAEQWNINLGN